MLQPQRKHIQLHDGCYCTVLKVTPNNWNDTKAPAKNLMGKNWVIWYRFYDPAVVGKNGKVKPKLVLREGMNKYKTISERREATRELLKDELELLQEEGYNPITDSFMIEHEDEFEGEINPQTGFIEALKKARELMTCSKRTGIDMKSVIKGIERSAIELRLQDVPVSKILRKHIKKMLARCETIYSLSPTRYNLYRGYLSMLYKELVEQEAVPGNPIWDISKKTIIKKIRPVLTEQERKRVNNHLSETFPRFQKFVHLFFHSGGRKTELLQLKPAMVDLVNQKYRCVVKKRKVWTEIERTIKDVAIEYWEFFLEGCGDDQYIFGQRFLPADKPMGYDMPTRYWQEYVKAPVKKGGLDIKVDFYALKHLNTSEVVDQLDEHGAAALNGHTSTDMVVKVYDTKQKDRQHQRLKKVNNSFA